MSSPRFVAWAAVSSLPQAKKISLDDQIETAKQHVARHQGELVATLRVPGESRSIVLFEEAAQRIEAYSQLRDLISRKAFDVLIYLDRSRLGRKASLSMAVVELCHEAGIQTYEMESPPESLSLKTGHDDMLLGAIKSVGAQQEVEKLKERHRKGMIGRTLAGKLSGPAVYGYRVAYDAKGRSKVVTVPEEAEVVRYVLIECYLVRCMSYVQIGEELNRIGAPQRNGIAWSKDQPQRMVNYVRRYAGYSEVNRHTRRSNRQYTIARGDWEPIITEEELAAILAESERRKPQGRRHLSGRRFSRVLRCDKCSGPVNVRTVKPRQNGNVSIYYQCTNRCPGAHIPEHKLIAYMEYAIDALQDEAYRDMVLRQAVPDRTADIDRQLDEISAHLDDVTKAKARLVRAYVEMAALSDEEFAAQKARLDEREDMLLKRAERLRAERTKAVEESKLGDRLVDIAERGRQMLHAPTKEANTWLRRRVMLLIRDGEVFAIQYR